MGDFKMTMHYGRLQMAMTEWPWAAGGCITAVYSWQKENTQWATSRNISFHTLAWSVNWLWQRNFVELLRLLRSEWERQKPLSYLKGRLTACLNIEIVPSPTEQKERWQKSTKLYHSDLGSVKRVTCGGEYISNCLSSSSVFSEP